MSTGKYKVHATKVQATQEIDLYYLVVASSKQEAMDKGREIDQRLFKDEGDGNFEVYNAEELSAQEAAELFF